MNTYIPIKTIPEVITVDQAAHTANRDRNQIESAIKRAKNPLTVTYFGRIMDGQVVIKSGIKCIVVDANWKGFLASCQQADKK